VDNGRCLLLEKHVERAGRSSTEMLVDDLEDVLMVLRDNPQVVAAAAGIPVSVVLLHIVERPVNCHAIAVCCPHSTCT
jgi:hypothetical protein